MKRKPSGMKAIVCTIIAGLCFVAGCYFLSLNKRYYVTNTSVFDNWTGEFVSTERKSNGYVIKRVY